MTASTLRCVRRAAILTSLLTVGGVTASMAQPVPVAPVRRGVALPPPGPPPDLPPGADALSPQTIRLSVTATASDGRVRTAVQTVTRTVDRVHVALAGGGEWLFERNPIDHRRVSGFAILHATRVVVAYSDTELRTMLGITGWAQVVTFGCAAPTLLPASCTSRDGATRMTVEHASPQFDRRLVALPAERFPGYREVDLADWLEDHGR